MKRVSWRVLGLLIFLFVVLNYFLTNFGILKLFGLLTVSIIGIHIALAFVLPLFTCIPDFCLLSDITSSSGRESEAEVSESTLMFFVWMLVAFANAFLICFWVSVVSHWTLPIVVIIGLIYMIVRTSLFLYVPMYFLS